jgi:hypothetical protein
MQVFPFPFGGCYLKKGGTWVREDEILRCVQNDKDQWGA